MDWKRLDRTRRSADWVQLDLIEHYAAGKINRRDFLRRGAIIGLAVPTMGAVIAACGDDSSTTSGVSGGGGAGGGIISIAIQPPSSGLDPINMLDQGTYNICSQTLEYLVGIDAAGGNIEATALATEWSVNEAGDVWTFKLREGVKWLDGSDLTSADVAATMDRLAVAENAGLGTVITAGAVDTPDSLTCVFQLENPNGNFPVLVSNFNAQSLITPVDYETGTLLDERPVGSGAWMLDSYDLATGAKFSPNPNWWGGSVSLDGVEIRHFDTVDTMVTAVQAGDVDAIQQFAVVGGEGLLNNPDFVVLTPPSGTHRQCWFNTSRGQFTDPRVRQAVAWTLDRERMKETLFNGRAEIGNDYPILRSMPFYDPDAVEQRVPDYDRARSLLADTEFPDGLSSVINCGNIQEVPDLAALIQSDARNVGIDLEISVHPQDTFYDVSWCPNGDGPQPCSESSDFGIVDWGHRPTPDVWLTSALVSNAVWNASAYADPDYDALVLQYQGSFTVEDQTAAISQIQTKLWEDVPAIYPYFYNYLSGHRSNVSGMVATALGHSVLTKATKT